MYILMIIRFSTYFRSISSKDQTKQVYILITFKRYPFILYYLHITFLLLLYSLMLFLLSVSLFPKLRRLSASIIASKLLISISLTQSSCLQSPSSFSIHEV
nr:MAG TPA: hypothetical protein [Caudoviricetes sp.]